MHDRQLIVLYDRSLQDLESAKVNLQKGVNLTHLMNVALVPKNTPIEESN